MQQNEERSGTEKHWDTIRVPGWKRERPLTSGWVNPPPAMAAMNIPGQALRSSPVGHRPRRRETGAAGGTGRQAKWGQPEAK